MHKAFVSWSSGKDSAWAFYTAQRSGNFHITGIITTLTETFNRVSMHGVREELLDLQSKALNLPCLKVVIPQKCTSKIYEQQMKKSLLELKAQGITHIIFGDLFLEDIRSYRENLLRESGLIPVFPLWDKDTLELAYEMIDSGLQAHLTGVDLNQLNNSFAGQRYDKILLDKFPSSIDPCGENGEFHTFVSAAPMFQQSIPILRGKCHTQKNFLFIDFLPTISLSDSHFESLPLIV